MKVSIVMPAYNAAPYIAEALDSCLKQDYDDYEVVVVNDGSTDSTQKIVEWFREKDPRVVEMGFINNNGQSFAMNRGINAASGDAICFAAADDIQLPNKISVLMDGLEEMDFCYSGYYHANIKGTPTVEVHPRELSKETIKANNGMSGGAIMAMKSVLQAVPFREDLRVNEDMALAWDLFKSGRTFRVIDQPTFCYRLTQKSMSYARKKEVETVTDQISKEIDAWHS